MNLVKRLMSLGQVSRGEGFNHEQERFAAQLRIEPIVDGRALLLRFQAMLLDGSIAHEECTLLGAGPDDNLHLWPVMSEWPNVLPHMYQPTAAVGGGRFTFASALRHGRRQLPPQF
jgi:hypothetical protein